MELPPAARRRLLTDDTVRGYTGDRIYMDRLEKPVAPLGARAVVLYAGSAWASSETYEGAGAEFPTLIVDCWADCTRDDTGDIRYTDRVGNARALWRAVHRLLHNPRRGQIWGRVGSNPGLLVNTSTQWVAPTTIETGTRRGIPLGDAAIVTATYALNIALLTG
jgi:hypothetical protein